MPAKKKQTVTKQLDKSVPVELGAKIEQLWIQKRRECLVVLDLIESMLAADPPRGNYVPFTYISEDEMEQLTDAANCLYATMISDKIDEDSMKRVAYKALSDVVYNDLHSRFMEHGDERKPVAE